MKAVLVILAALAVAASAAPAPVDAAWTKCDGCQTMVKLVEFYVSQGATVEMIKRHIAEFCKLLGPKYAGICTLLIDGQLDQIIEWLQKHEPREVCAKIRLCPKAIEVSGPKCTICKVAVEVVAHYITDPHTEQQIINLLAKLCARFPKYESVCDQLVAYGIMELIELIKQYADSTLVCEKVKLC